MIGTDLNRIWTTPSKYLHPTVYYTKELLRQLHSGEYHKGILNLNLSQQETSEETKILDLMSHKALTNECFKTPKVKLKFKKKLIKVPSSKARSSLHPKSKKANSKLEKQFRFEANVILFVDIHGHSINDNIFMYGCKGVNSEETDEIKEIPNLINKDLTLKSQERFYRLRKFDMSCND